MSRHPFIAREWLAWRERKKKRKESKKQMKYEGGNNKIFLVDVSFIQYLYD